MFTVDQLLLHVLGDYVLQTEHMAANKAKNTWVALYHGLVYTLPFLVICQAIPALVVIWLSHALIDRFRLARYISQLKNTLGEPGNYKTYQTDSGFPSDMPPWMSTWLLVIIDNFVHIVINGLSIYYL